MADRWNENAKIETRVKQPPCGRERFADRFPGLTDDGKEFEREDV